MKKMNIIFIGMLVFASFVIAEDNEIITSKEKLEEMNVDDAIKLSQLSFGEKLSLVFTFNKEKKIRKELEFAEKRLVAAEKLAELGKEDALKNVVRVHEELVEKARERYNTLEGKNEKKLLESQARIEKKFLNFEDKASILNERLLENENIPAEVREEIRNKIKINSQGFNKEMEEKKEGIINQWQEAKQVSEEEMNRLMLNVEEETGLRESIMVRAKNKIRTAENILASFKRQLKDELEFSDEELEQNIIIDLNELDTVENESEEEKKVEENRISGNIVTEQGKTIKQSQNAMKTAVHNAGETAQNIIQNKVYDLKREYNLKEISTRMVKLERNELIDYYFKASELLNQAKTEYNNENFIEAFKLAEQSIEVVKFARVNFAARENIGSVINEVADRIEQEIPIVTSENESLVNE